MKTGTAHWIVNTINKKLLMLYIKDFIVIYHGLPGHKGFSHSKFFQNFILVFQVKISWVCPKNISIDISPWDLSYTYADGFLLFFSLVFIWYGGHTEYKHSRTHTVHTGYDHYMFFVPSCLRFKFLTPMMELTTQDKRWWLDALLQFFRPYAKMTDRWVLVPSPSTCLDDSSWTPWIGVFPRNKLRGLMSVEMNCQCFVRTVWFC